MDFIEANGAGLRCELSGGGDRTLVLVHEMGGSLESWDDVAPRFAKARRVLRYDTRGAGMSQKVRGELTLETMADDIAALLDHLDRRQGRACGDASGVPSPCTSRPDIRAHHAVAVGSPATGIARSRAAALSALHGSIRRHGGRVRDSMLNAMPRSFAATSPFERFRRDGSATILKLCDDLAMLRPRMQENCRLLAVLS